MSDPTQHAVDETFLWWIVSPIERDYDCDEGDYPELEVPGLNSNDGEEVKRRVIRPFILPWFERWTEESKRILKDSLRYYLNVPSPRDRYIGMNLFQRIIDGSTFAFPGPNDPHDFFIWIWEELFGAEDYRLNDLSGYREKRIVRPNQGYRLLAEQPEISEIGDTDPWATERTLRLQRLKTLSPGKSTIKNPLSTLRITLATPEEAPIAHRIMLAAFAELEGLLDPPNGAVRETVADVVEAMQEGGAVLGWEGDKPVASARFVLKPDHLYVGRVSVLPTERERGIASAVMRYLEEVAYELERPEIQLGTREQLAHNVALYQKLGYEIVQTIQHPRGQDRIVCFRKPIPPPPGV